MKRLAVLLVPLVVWAGPALVQRIELHAQPIAMGLAADASRPVLYLATYNDVILAFDCNRREVSAVIEVDYYGTQTGMAWDWRRNKMYFPFHIGPDSIMVIDCRNDSVLGFVEGGASGAICYASSVDRVYYSSRGPGHLRAIDCHTDSISVDIAPVAPDKHAGSVSWDSVCNKVYVGSSLHHDAKYLKSFSCETGAMVGRFDCNVFLPDRMLFVPAYRRAYFGGNWFTTPLVSIDCVQDTLLRSHSVSYNGYRPPVWNPVENEVYAISYDQRGYSVAVIDCATDSVTSWLPHSWSGLLRLAWLPWCNYLYIMGGDGVSVFDCAADSLVEIDFEVGEGPIDMVADHANQVVYVACSDGSLSILREDGSGVSEPLEPGPRGGALQPTTVIRGSWWLRTGSRGSVLDATGRRAARLVLGENDLAHVSPGVYFVVSDDAERSRKVVVQR